MVVYYLLQKMNDALRRGPGKKYLHVCPEDFKKKDKHPVKIKRHLKPDR